MASKKNGSKAKENIQKTNNTEFISLTIAGLSAFFALLAVIVSIWSWNVSERSYRLAEKQDLEKKTAIWIGEYYKDKKEIKFTSSSDEIKLQIGNVIFPKEMEKGKSYIQPPNFTFPTTLLEVSLSEYVNKSVPRSPDHISVAEMHIPFVVQSQYIAAGNTYSVQSMYQLIFLSTVSHQEFKMPTVEIQGIIFNRHLDINEDAAKVLESEWERIKSQAK
ncbi:hypothetical protein [Paenibacillus favisporus]|uniref:hypothetical protein n=1 Tax=Paenibacillus favisporus TaxID=221028 RepID=UPI0013D15C29|nr:hypothetical protein [Paenibacillus favisporus]